MLITEANLKKQRIFSTEDFVFTGSWIVKRENAILAGSGKNVSLLRINKTLTVDGKSVRLECSADIQKLWSEFSEQAKGSFACSISPLSAKMDDFKINTKILTYDFHKEKVFVFVDEKILSMFSDSETFKAFSEAGPIFAFKDEEMIAAFMPFKMDKAKNYLKELISTK